MNLVAESGSTKTDWMWTGSVQKAGFQTSGYNPYVQGMENLISCLESELIPALQGEIPEKIWFYGSGFSHPDFNLQLEKWFQEKTGARFCSVEHDMLGAARAACMDQPGIVAILGTGSNTCRYDGSQIVEYKGGHGYLFGDEGSGADLGKRLVKGVLDAEFPEVVSQKILQHTNCTSPVQLRNSIHGRPRPNVALAALAPLVLQLSAIPEIEKLIEDSFSSFLKKTLLRYPEIQVLPLYFTGSIALHFRPWLEKVMERYPLKSSGYISRPVEKLVLYHEKIQS